LAFIGPALLAKPSFIRKTDLRHSASLQQRLVSGAAEAAIGGDDTRQMPRRLGVALQGRL
jgi:hypothetical protein